MSKLESLLKLLPFLEDDAPKQNPQISNLLDGYVGKYVIVRDRNEGINFGLVEKVDHTGVVLSRARRIWRTISKDKSLSWYEGIAQSGLCEEKGAMSCEVITKVIISDNFSMTEVDSSIIPQLQGFKTNETTY